MIYLICSFFNVLAFFLFKFIDSGEIVIEDDLDWIVIFVALVSTVSGTFIIMLCLLFWFFLSSTGPVVKTLSYLLDKLPEGLVIYKKK